jgi:hypothetical protein
VIRNWDRYLWGVRFRGGDPRDRDLLIGTAWNDPRAAGRNPGDPTRALLFCTRAAARAWCAARMAGYADRPVGDICRAWRFTPVRVRERVEVVKP